MRVRYGFGWIFVLLRRQGWKANHKRVHRLYCQAGLNQSRKRPRSRKAAAHRLERTVLTGPNHVWSMDFVADALFDGRRFRALTIVDNFSKERLRHQRDLLQRIQTDNGSEFISMVMDRWAYDNGVTMQYPAPANRPTLLSSNRSLAVFGMRASTRTGSCRLPTPVRSSKTGGSMTLISGRTPRPAMSRRPSLSPDSPAHPKPNFPVLLGPDVGRRSISTRRATDRLGRIGAPAASEYSINSRTCTAMTPDTLPTPSTSD
ncbi:ISxcC1 transposase [Xanthomonas bromi]|uniref:ISxcC1 transposase n=1 Tax=Xanthomonas bromi TaxID=56449 RepID=A0A1C3NLM2_9XANT|nr:ISxcC1 transposase [Xanthomonas bromi]